ncbi:MAG: DMT family transporter, partial [SAR324 cluster bacterium]|nr:DMT family transporter [SAR324 cluster bacterium]
NVSRLVIASTLLLGSEEIRNELSGLSYSQWSMLALAAFFGPFLGRVTYTYSLKYMTISKAMLLGMLSPVLTIVVEYHLYGTLISPSEMGGSLLIILGIVWSFLPTLLNKSS